MPLSPLYHRCLFQRNRSERYYYNKGKKRGASRVLYIYIGLYRTCPFANFHEILVVVLTATTPFKRIFRPPSCQTDKCFHTLRPLSATRVPRSDDRQRKKERIAKFLFSLKSSLRRPIRPTKRRLSLPLSLSFPFSLFLVSTKRRHRSFPRPSVSIMSVTACIKCGCRERQKCWRKILVLQLTPIINSFFARLLYRRRSSAQNAREKKRKR